MWDGLVKILEVDLFSPAWEVRHGAAMALRELLKAQGKYCGTRGLIFLFIVRMWHLRCHSRRFTYRKRCMSRAMVQCACREASLCFHT